MSYTFSWTLLLQQHASGPVGSPKRAGMFQTWTFCESFRFWRQKGHQLEAEASKVSQTGVDIINMAAPARFFACAVGTPEFEGLLLSKSVLEMNGRGGVAMKKTRTL
jgi:hypothetical protein